MSVKITDVMTFPLNVRRRLLCNCREGRVMSVSARERKDRARSEGRENPKDATLPYPHYPLSSTTQGDPGPAGGF
jgi:hypothetical protein